MFKLVLEKAEKPEITLPNIRWVIEKARELVQSLRQEDPLEKEMAPHSSIFAWEIPWTEEPGGLPSMGSHRVRHD